MAEGVNKGLYVSIGIRPTNGLTNYIEGMPPEYGKKLDSATRHVTITYPFDFLVSGIEESDPEPLNQARDLLDLELEALDLDGMAIMPEEPWLVPLERHMAIPIEATECIRRAHKKTSRIVAEIFGVVIPDWRMDYHASLTRLPIGEGVRRPGPRRLPFPNGFLAKGHVVEVDNAPLIPRYIRNPRRSLARSRILAGSTR
jgi:hypothetical protein